MASDEYEKFCPECEGCFHAKRLNQVYCGISCKTRFNNRLARENRYEEAKQKAITENIDAIIWKNRQILSKYQGEVMSLSDLRKEGFKTNFITQFSIREGEQNILYCYDLRYYFTNGYTIKILYDHE